MFVFLIRLLPQKLPFKFFSKIRWKIDAFEKRIQHEKVTGIIQYIRLTSSAF